MPTNISSGFRHPLGNGVLTEAIDGDGFYVAQNFNAFNQDIGAAGSFHLGEDWNGEAGGNTDLGLPVYAISNGEVTQAGFLASLGNYVVIKHILPTALFIDGAFRTEVVSLYAHLQNFPSLSVGQIVGIGDQIGNIGFSGAAGGFAHLHFEIRLGTQFIDPDGYNPSGAPTGWVDPTNFINAHRTLGQPDDYAGNTGTTGVITPGGGQIFGNIETPADRDWFRIQVTQGSTYTIDLVSGSPPQVGPFLGDPEVYLYNSSGQLVASNDDSNGLNSQLTFTATYTGAYFIGASEHGDNATGTYRLSVSIGSAPEIAVSGSGVNIADGDLSPSGVDGTDFGSVTQGSVVEHVFTVSNTGAGTLTTSGLTLPAGFTVVDPLSSSIAAGSFDTFRVRLDTSSTGTKFGQITFNTNDSNEAAFNFQITGTVNAQSAPEIVVSGSGANIADGDLSPISTDGTNFGTVTQGSVVEHVFTVSNTGTGTLTTSGLTVPAGFTVVDPLSSSITAGSFDTFRVRLDTSSSGTKSGQITFNTNDSDEAAFNFQITGTVNASNHAPAVTVTNPNVQATSTQAIALSGLVNATDADNDAFAYVFYDSTAGGGHFEVNGVTKQAGTVFAVSASQLSQTTFVPVAGSSDNLLVGASDGKDFSGWSSLHINGPTNVNHAPVVTVPAPNVQATSSQAIALSALVGATDPDNNAFSYLFYDLTAGGGHFEVNGVAKAASTIFAVTATQLSQVTFVPSPGTSDDLLVGATDGSLFSGWSSLHINGPTSVNHAPVVTVPNPNVQATSSQAIALSTLAGATDADNDAFSYLFYDATAGGGHFEVSGVTKAAGAIFGVAATQLSQVTFVPAQVGGADDLLVGASDGKLFSGWSSLHINGPTSVNSAPVVTVPNPNVQANSGQTLQIASLVSATDANNNPFAYLFFDATPGGGHFEVNGVVKPEGQIFSVPAAQIAQVTFIAGTGADDLLVGATDGSFSGWSLLHVL